MLYLQRFIQPSKTIHYSKRCSFLVLTGSTIHSLVKDSISSLSFPRRKLLPEPHLAYRPTVMGMVRAGSVRMSAKALLYKSQPKMFSPSSLAFNLNIKFYRKAASQFALFSLNFLIPFDLKVCNDFSFFVFDFMYREIRDGKKYFFFQYLILGKRLLKEIHVYVVFG